MTKKVPPGGQKMNFGKNRLHEVNRRAMLIGKMVSLLILPFGNPKSANGWHPYLRILFPFRFNWTYSKEIDFLSWKFHWNKFRLRLFALKFSNFALAKLAYWVSLTICSHSAAWISDWKCGKRIAINPSKCRQYKRKEEIFCWNGKFVVGFGQYNFKTSWPQKISTFKKRFYLKNYSYFNDW